ncbi:MAG: ATP-binding protein [Pseudomonadales bacterium]
MVSPAPYSLRRRMLLTLVPVLVLAMLLLGLALAGSQRAAAEAALYERLQLQVRLLLADAESREKNDLAADPIVSFPAQASEPGLNQPQSGLYGIVLDDAGALRWISISTQASDRDWIRLGEALLSQANTAAQGELLRGRLQEFYFVSRRVAFAFAAIDAASGENTDAEAQPLREELPAAEADSEQLSGALTLLVLDDGAALLAQQRTYRAVLWRWLGLAVTSLAVVQLLLLFWSFRPLSALVEELQSVERGSQHTFAGKYPAEIAPLTENLNRFVESERMQGERYRNTLADLAHSLKTPLAALRAGIESDAVKASLLEPIARMDSIINYQLTRARPMASHRMATRRCAPGDSLAPLLRSLQKVYRDKHVVYTESLPPGILLAMGDDELLELLGNVLDNAFQYCRSKVQLRGALGSDPGDAHRDTHGDTHGDTPAPAVCRLQVDDDGPGIATAQVARVLARGARLDEQQPGQGIGLAVAAEIVAARGGRLQIQRSELGGASVQMVLPAITG